MDYGFLRGISQKVPLSTHHIKGACVPTKLLQLCLTATPWTVDHWLLSICHIFFIHSSVNEHLGCSHILTIVKNGAMNIEMLVSFKMNGLGFLDFFLDIYLGVKLFGHIIVLLHEYS